MIQKHEVNYIAENTEKWEKFTSPPEPIIKQFYIDRTNTHFGEDVVLEMQYDPRFIEDAKEKEFLVSPKKEHYSGAYYQYEWTFSATTS